jgi:ribosomal-protein-serine acetyltransferase
LGAGEDSSHFSMKAHQLPDRIEGSRLTLRRWVVADAPIIAASVERNLEHLRPWMPWVANEPLPMVDRLILLDTWEREWLAGGDAVMAILLKGEVVGGTGLHRRRGPHGIEIGYWVDKDHLGQHIAREAASMLTTAALARSEISFVEIHHDKANIRSARIPEELGYAFVGESPDNVDAPGEIGIDCAWRVASDMWHED